jgi:hypothetical protein
MNIDFADENSPAGIWWRDDAVPEQQANPPPEEVDLGPELRVFQEFNHNPPEEIDIYDPDSEAAQDALLASLTNAAYAIGKSPKTAILSKRSRRDKNPFFYFRTKSFTEDLEDHKEVAEPQRVAMEHIDAEVERRLKTYEKELSSSLEKNIEAVREFFLTEVDPLSLGIQGGTAQVQSLMARIFPDGIDTEQFHQFVHMAKQARKIKMANFIANYMGLDISEAERIADSLTPRKEVMVIGPTPDERMQQQPPIERKPRTRERISMAGERERVGTSDISARAPRGR